MGLCSIPVGVRLVCLLLVGKVLKNIVEFCIGDSDFIEVFSELNLCIMLLLIKHLLNFVVLKLADLVE